VDEDQNQSTSRRSVYFFYILDISLLNQFGYGLLDLFCRSGSVSLPDWALKFSLKLGIDKLALISKSNLGSEYRAGSITDAPHVLPVK
jgi:hypothetical protein